MWESTSDRSKLVDKICLTYSQGSEGRSWTRKRTSAKAGCASSLTLSVQPKVRSPLDQDMVMFPGASNFTAEQSHVLNWHFYSFMHLFWLRNGAKMSGACSTCVFEYHRGLVWLAAGGSDLSRHPDFCWLIYEQFIFKECVPGVLNGRKSFYSWTVTWRRKEKKWNWAQITLAGVFTIDDPGPWLKIHADLSWFGLSDFLNVQSVALKQPFIEVLSADQGEDLVFNLQFLELLDFPPWQVFLQWIFQFFLCKTINYSS